MPFVPEALLRALSKRRRRMYDAFCRRARPARRGAVCAYMAGVWPAIARRLESGDLKAISFHPMSGSVSLPRPGTGLREPDELFFNVNTPDDLERAEALWQRRA